MRTIKTLQKKIARMPRAELEQLAANVVVCLYGTFKGGGRVPFLDAENEWTQDTIENVAEQVDNAGLNPDKL